jgi:SNF2 family DNA or RNA helicase
MSDAGTGKTYVRIIRYLKRRAGKKCMLVIAPRNLMHAAWAEDIKKFAPSLRVSVCTAANREKAFAAEADVYVTNVDAAKWLAKKKRPFFAKFDELVMDESSAFKNAMSQRSKAMAVIVKFFEYRTAMSATPNSKSILDIWHQAFLLDGGKRLGASYYAFRNVVCTPVPRIGLDGKPIKNAEGWEEKEGAREAVYDLLRDITIRHRRQDCVDLPDNHRYTIPHHLSPKHRLAYNELRDTSLLMIEREAAKLAKANGRKHPDPSDYDFVIAKNKAVVGVKLLQLASGAVYESKDKYHVIDRDRYGMVADLVEARDHSFILYQWKHQRDLLLEEFKARGITCAEIVGSDEQRAATVARFQAGHFDVIMAHPRSSAHGLTLTRGTATIWPSPTVDTELFEQGSLRQWRIGQTKKTETITILGENTYDHRAYFDICLNKGERMGNFLEMFK